MAMPRLKIGLTLIIIMGGLILWGNNPWLVAGVLAALVIHELSHILTSLLLGYQVSELKLTIFGGCMTIDPLFEANPNAEMLIAAAGPAINFVMVLGAVYLGFLGFHHDYLEYWRQLNLGIGLLNLLPAYPLDGGRMIHACLAQINGFKTAARVSRGLTLGVALFFLISGSIQALLKTGGITFLMVGTFIFAQLWYGKAPELNFWQIRRQKQKSLRQKGFLNAKLILVEPGTPLQVPLKYYGSHEYLIFFMEGEGKKFRLISEEQAWNILSKEGYQATFNPPEQGRIND